MQLHVVTPRRPQGDASTSSRQPAGFRGISSPIKPAAVFHVPLSVMPPCERRPGCAGQTLCPWGIPLFRESCTPPAPGNSVKKQNLGNRLERAVRRPDILLRWCQAYKTALADPPQTTPRGTGAGEPRWTPPATARPRQQSRSLVRFGRPWELLQGSPAKSPVCSSSNRFSGCSPPSLFLWWGWG